MPPMTLCQHGPRHAGEEITAHLVDFRLHPGINYESERCLLSRPGQMSSIAPEEAFEWNQMVSGCMMPAGTPQSMPRCLYGHR